MTSEELCEIPFREIGEALRDSPHSRRLSGVLLACFKGFEFPDAIAEYCMSPEFAIPLENSKNPMLVGRLLEAGFLSDKRVRTIAGMAKNHTNAGDKEILSTIFTALGSPQLGDMARELLVEFPKNAHSERDRLFHAALLGNPLIHGSEEVPEIKDVLERRVFLVNTAKFGNLANSDIAGKLKDILMDEADSGPNEDANWVRWRLMSRKDLPEELVIALHKSPATTESAHEELVKNPTHQKLVLSGKLEACKMFADEERYVVSPAATSAKVEEVFNRSNGSLQWMQSLLTGAQFPREIYQQRFSCDKSLASNLKFLRQSPFANEFVDGMGKRAFFAEFSEKNLEQQADEGLGLMTVTIPVVPFDVIAPAQMKDVFHEKKDYVASLIVGAIRSREFVGHLGSVNGTMETDLPLLFSPQTSGRQLENFAGLHPQLAVLAACHPNGVDIPTQRLPALHRRVAERVRGAVPLAGRLGGRQQGGGSEISL